MSRHIENRIDVRVGRIPVLKSTEPKVGRLLEQYGFGNRIASPDRWFEIYISPDDPCEREEIKALEVLIQNSEAQPIGDVISIHHGRHLCSLVAFYHGGQLTPDEHYDVQYALQTIGQRIANVLWEAGL